MGEHTKINTNDLKSIAIKMEEKSNQIMDIYNKSIKEIIKESEKKIIESGESMTVIENDFKKTFTDFDESMKELTNTLKNKIIPVYENVASDIVTLFNSSFAKEMSSILESNKDGN